MLYHKWKAEVDKILVKKTGLDSDDLPDYCYYMAWEDGSSPADVAAEVLEENGYETPY